MGYINRFLLFLYALAVGLASLGVAVLCFSVFPQTVVLNEAAFLLSRWETAAGAGAVFLLSVHLAGCSLFAGGAKERRPEEVVVYGAQGAVHVAASAVSELAERVAARVHGVETAAAKVAVTEAPSARSSAAQKVKVRIEARLSGGRKVTEASDAIHAAVSEQMTEVLGLADYSIDISVTGVAGGEAAKKPRVS